MLFTEANAFDRVEEFVDQIDSILDSQQMKIYMDPTIVRWYLRDKRNTHGTDVNYNAEKPTVDFYKRANCRFTFNER